MSDITQIIAGDTLHISDSGITVVDNLNSSSATDALSANQGRILAGQIADIPAGPEGPQGPAGPPGTNGSTGPSGRSVQVFVSSTQPTGGTYYDGDVWIKP